MSDSVSPDSNWTKEQLMGNHDAATLESKKKADPNLWGRPGYLTEEEAKTYVSTSTNSNHIFIQETILQIWDGILSWNLSAAICGYNDDINDDSIHLSKSILQNSNFYNDRV